MLNQYAVDNPTLPVNLRSSHLSEILAGCKASLWECRAAETGRQAFGKHMVHWETFLQTQPRLLQHFIRKMNPWSSGISEPIHSSTAEKNENQTPVQHQRCQSGPSTKNSVIPREGHSSKNYGAEQERLHISDLHLDKVSTPATCACWKIILKTEVCTRSQFPTEAMHWINEVGWLIQWIIYNLRHL